MLRLPLPDPELPEALVSDSLFRRILPRESRNEIIETGRRDPTGLLGALVAG